MMFDLPTLRLRHRIRRVVVGERLRRILDDGGKVDGNVFGTEKCFLFRSPRCRYDQPDWSKL